MQQKERILQTSLEIGRQSAQTISPKLCLVVQEGEK